jgi:hypothetical protein
MNRELPNYIFNIVKQLAGLLVFNLCFSSIKNHKDDTQVYFCYLFCGQLIYVFSSQNVSGMIDNK